MSVLISIRAIPNAAITSSLPREQQGVASAPNDLTRELGAALGIALLGGLLVAGYQNAGEHAEQILTASQEAFIAGWQQAMWVGVAVMTALVLFIILRGPKSTASTADSNEKHRQ